MENLFKLKNNLDYRKRITILSLFVLVLIMIIIFYQKNKLSYDDKKIENEKITKEQMENLIKDIPDNPNKIGSEEMLSAIDKVPENQEKINREDMLNLLENN